MCGITGQISCGAKIGKQSFLEATHMLKHRGPDGFGNYFSENGKLAFGHRRLSFLDLSAAGNQPFISNNGSVVLTLNGEIYNYTELKTELKNSYQFKTHTDTEVLVAAYTKWGIDCLRRIRGMFAFGLYDSQSERLYLARDRFGIKPLYYANNSNGLTFASELKALLALSPERKKLDFSAMADYFVYRYVPSPKTIWEGVKKIPPAHYLEFNVKNGASTFTEYWKISSGSITKSPHQLTASVNHLLKTSVNEHLRADVPIGSFLSGGYDSSALALLMNQSEAPPQTFSVGFDEWDNSEHHYANIVSKHLNLQNESVILNEKSLQLVDKMPQVYDEPIADISIVPTYAVSRLASKSVKAVFSGEGADELFGGYTWQQEFYNQCYPEKWTEKLKNILQPPDVISHYAHSMAMGLFERDELLKMFQPEYHQFIPEDVLWFYRKHLRKDMKKVKAIQYLDVKTFMAELVLTKIDRASMANSLEVRVPFLDHRLFEEIFSSNESSYLNPKQTKSILYKCIKNQLPKEILARKKQGFVGPDSYYMNNKWYVNELENSALVRDGIIRRSYIDSQLSKTYTWKLWKILIMERWYKDWVG